MQYGKVCLAAATATLSVFTVVGTAWSADNVIWNLSAWGGPRAVTRGIEYVAAELPKRTDGHFQLKIHYGEEISPAKANLDGLKVQAFEAAMFCSSYAPGKTPVMTALDLPFLPLPDFKTAVRVHQAYFEVPEAKAELAKWNAVGYLPNALPHYEIMGVGEPPRKLEDWNGRRVRALGGLGDAMRKIGAVPTTMPAPEIYTALSRGMIDSVSLPFSYSFASYKLDELAKWYTSNLNLGTVGCHMIVSKSALGKLPAEYRDLLWSLRDGANKAQGEAYAAADRVEIPKYKKMGLTEIRYSEAELARFREKAGRPVWNDWVADMKSKGIPGQKLLDFILHEAKQPTG